MEAGRHKERVFVYIWVIMRTYDGQASPGTPVKLKSTVVTHFFTYNSNSPMIRIDGNTVTPPTPPSTTTASTIEPTTSTAIGTAAGTNNPDNSEKRKKIAIIATIIYLVILVFVGITILVVYAVRRARRT